MPAEVAENAGERFGCVGRRVGVGSEVAVGLAKKGLAEGGDLLRPLVERCGAFDEGAIAIRLERAELRRERGRFDGEALGCGAPRAGCGRATFWNRRTRSAPPARRTALASGSG